MCGIIAFIGKKQINIESFIENTKHRGKDSSKTISIDNVVLGINRLAIVDINNGDQPLFNDNKDVCLVGNGFIYNYEAINSDLRDFGIVPRTLNDFQVVPYLYQQYGTDCVKYLEGMFAFCLYDKQSKIFMACRDHIGKKPLYFLNDNGDYYFASESKAFLEMNINIDNIQELGPGCQMILENNEMIMNQYYTFPITKTKYLIHI